MPAPFARPSAIFAPQPLILRDGAARGFGPGNIELAGTERTAFVKGVASLLYGTTTSANGAAANYITKKPEPEFFLRGDASLGGFASRRATVDLDLPPNFHPAAS